MLIVAEEGISSSLANGRARRSGKPEAQTRKATIRGQGVDEADPAQARGGGRLTNSEIRKALALWTGSETTFDRGGGNEQWQR